MATVTATTTLILPTPTGAILVSTRAFVAKADDVEIIGIDNPGYWKCFLGVHLFDADYVATESTIAGSIDVLVRTMVNNAADWVDVGTNIDATAPVTISVDEPVVSAKFDSDGTGTYVYYKPFVLLTRS